jgi:hypothetical protein
VPGKLTVQSDGRVTGPASITYNTPFPTANGSWGSGAMMGVVMHTMVGNLPGTISEFNSPSAQASAHFGVDQQGNIHQFGPIGKGWIAWAQAAGNEAWYSIEHADGGNPNTPLTLAQVTASAQLVECLSGFAGFPLQVSDATTVQGYGTHFMGGAAWGGHSCPDLPPQHVRSAQRAAIISLAGEIRSGQFSVKTDGTGSLAQLAEAAGTAPSTVLRMTAIADGVYPAPLAAWLNSVLAGTAPASSPLPAGLVLRIPA